MKGQESLDPPLFPPIWRMAAFVERRSSLKMTPKKAADCHVFLRDFHHCEKQQEEGTPHF